jgi:hypothetical protein
MGQGQSQENQSHKPSNSQGQSSVVQAQAQVVPSNSSGVTAQQAGKGRGWKKRKNLKGGVTSVHWDRVPMNQPSNQVMEWATTAPKSLCGGRRRTHKHRGHKKSHKAKRHHRRSKRHH